MKNLTIAGLAVAGLVASASAQVIQVTTAPGTPTGFLDFDNPPVPVGPIAGNDPAFTSVGISNVSLFGTFSTGDSVSSGFNGNVLVSTGGGAGTLTVQAPGGPMDNLQAGAGFRFDFSTPVTAFGFVFVDQTNHNYDVTLYSGGTMIATGTFSVTGGFPNPPTFWHEASFTPFDRIDIAANGFNGGWGPDDIWVQAIPAPGSLALLGLGGLAALRRRR